VSITKTFKFHEVFAEEIKAVNARRKAHGRTDFAKLEDEQEPPAPAAARSEHGDSTPPGQSSQALDRDPGRPAGREPDRRPTANSNLIGLALSGGGIRSASFCLGALQALDKADVLKRVDYLSTVSGGGYIGCSLSAAMTKTGGKFPFRSSLTPDEPYPIQHIRDNSNYLFPSGRLTLFSNIAIYLRGLIANVLHILPWLLLAAAITIFVKPTTEDLDIATLLGLPLPAVFERGFGVSLLVLSVFGAMLLLWGLWRSLELSGWEAEVGSPWTLVCALILLFLLVTVFCELQPAILRLLFESEHAPKGFFASLDAFVRGLVAALAPFAAAVAFFSRHIAKFLKAGDGKPTFAGIALRVASRAAVYVAGAAVPFLLWIAYLYLSFAGIRDVAGYYGPAWIVGLAHGIFGERECAVGWLYLSGFAILFAVSWVLSPNANSLHRLYRDRLSKAFLFDPTTIQGRPGGANQGVSTSLDVPIADNLMRYENFELAPMDRFKVSDIVTTSTPYHLINTALNIQGSKFANRRGRNADFFMFSPKFVGSSATQFALTKEIEDEVRELDLATAMAVSGAAASSNMGSNSIKALTPTLAILNVRLGYWMKNPRRLTKEDKRRSLKDYAYFLQELFGLMDETRGEIYLSDGGHVENLGIYELLQRRCRLIIAVDAEADPEMSFGSLVKLQRYARIDMGVLIDLPWAEIRDVTRDASAEIAKSGGLPPQRAPQGPHCSIGTIRYPDGRDGILIYVKSSISGDENDDIVDYKRRFPAFPHETTADQLFSEEQFEVYRALGFHAVNEMFGGRNDVCNRPTPIKWEGAALGAAPIKDAKDLLNWVP